jgi:hypothetical protein
VKVAGATPALKGGESTSFAKAVQRVGAALRRSTSQRRGSRPASSGRGRPDRDRAERGGSPGRVVRSTAWTPTEPFVGHEKREEITEAELAPEPEGVVEVVGVGVIRDPDGSVLAPGLVAGSGEPLREVGIVAARVVREDRRVESVVPEAVVRDGVVVPRPDRDV